MPAFAGMTVGSFPNAGPAPAFAFPHPPADASYAPVRDGGRMMAIDEALATQVLQALARGDRIAAVKLVRQMSGSSLRDAVQFVEAQAAGARGRALKQDMQRAAAGGVPPPRIPPVRDERHGLQAHARNEMQALRAHDRTPTVEMGDAPGGPRWLLPVLCLLVLVAWLAFAEA